MTEDKIKQSLKEEALLDSQRSVLFRRIQIYEKKLHTLKNTYSEVHRKLLFLQKERILAAQAQANAKLKSAKDTNPLKEAGLTPEEFAKAYELLKDGREIKTSE